MTGLRKLARAAAALSFAAAAGASAQQFEGDRLILSNDWGNGATIGAMEDMRRDLPPADVSGPDVVAEFKRLCLDTNFDPAAHAQAALASGWGFERREVVLAPPGGKKPSFAFTDYRSASAITSLWRGENGEALKGWGYAARSRGAVITGPVKAKDLYAPQCNLSVATRGISDAAPLAAALEQALGQPAAKVVLKASFADGNWKIAGPSGETRRVSFDVVDMKKAIQLVHLTVQTLPPAKP
jgi:hypothetical protein